VAFTGQLTQLPYTTYAAHKYIRSLRLTKYPPAYGVHMDPPTCGAHKFPQSNDSHKYPLASGSGTHRDPLTYGALTYGAHIQYILYSGLQPVGLLELTKALGQWRSQISSGQKRLQLPSAKSAHKCPSANGAHEYSPAKGAY
jgi:hypothetical protein